MLHLFGSSLPINISGYFSKKARQNGDRTIFASMAHFGSSEASSELEIQGLSRADLDGQPVCVWHSFAQVAGLSANDYFTQMLLAGDTLKRYGAGPLWASIPFGPFARQDQERPGKMDSVACDMAARHLAMDYVGISTVEIHSKEALAILENRFGKGNAFSLSPSDIFTQNINALGIQKPVIVSPDKGANVRADEIAELLDADRFYIDKERNEIINTRIVGSKGDVDGCPAVLIDDMGDTIGTIANGAKLVRAKGATSVYVYLTHAVLTYPAWERMAHLIRDGVVDGIRLGDTISRRAEYENFAQQYGPDIAEKIEFISTAEMLYAHTKSAIAQHPLMSTPRR